jgi:hypothetical protein
VSNDRQQSQAEATVNRITRVVASIQITIGWLLVLIGLLYRSFDLGNLILLVSGYLLLKKPSIGWWVSTLLSALQAVGDWTTFFQSPRFHSTTLYLFGQPTSYQTARAFALGSAVFFSAMAIALLCAKFGERKGVIASSAG